MSNNDKISISNCFLFLLNVIVGTGVFLNTVQLYFLLKEYSYLAYLITGFLMIPIIGVTYLLAYENPGANLTALFYKYFGSLNILFVPLYALSKFATPVIGIIFISVLLKNIFFSTVIGCFFNILFFLLIYLLCGILVYYDISMSYLIQKVIIIIKLVPLIGIILFFLFYFFYDSAFSFLISSQKIDIFNSFKLAQGASITIFAFSGFESLFAINHLLKGGKKKGAFLLAVSFLSAWLLYVLYQFCIGNLAHFFLIDNTQLLPFASFLSKCFSQIAFSSVFILLVNIAIMVSSFGVAHGVMYATVNNLFCSLPFVFGDLKYAKYFVFLLVPCYALFGIRDIFILQQLASLGTIITYGLFVMCYKKMKNRNNILLLLSILSILIFLMVHIYNAFNYFGFIGYLIYLFFIVLLLCLNFYSKKVE